MGINMTREEQFAQTTGLLLRYETGDFMLLSDLSDSLTALKDHFLDVEEACSLIGRLLRFVSDEMKLSGKDRFVETLSDAIDLLGKLEPGVEGRRREEIIAKIAAFACDAGAKAEAEPVRDREALQIFLSEIADRLDQAQAIILKLEEQLDNPEHIQSLFRIFHTIKGECGFLKIASLGELAHNIENLLDLLRSRKQAVLPEHIELLLEGIDVARRIHDRLGAGDFVVVNTISMDDYLSALRRATANPCSNLGEILVAEGKIEEADVVRVLQKQKETAYTKRFGEIAVQENLLSAEELRNTLERQQSCLTGESAKSLEKSDPIIKVKSSKVNFLVDMIGELLIVMGQINESSPAMMQMRKITRSLQFGAMELRTETLQSLFGNIRRVVRDVSRQLGKNVRLSTVGEDLEIDRNLIEKLEEPLIHLVRNSLDHGIGFPDERTAAGKDPQGTITLKAERLGNSIVITVRDDGHGLNRKKILSKAIERGVARKDSAESLSDAQVYNFIFESGFSTHEAVTLISGRGVGMDIVRTMVSENRGRIEIETREGAYTEFRLLFPLSTAIIDGMITRVGSNLFVFPIGSVVESIKIRKDLLSTVNGYVEVANLRGETIPALRMHELFDIPDDDPAGVHIGVVCEASDRRKFMMILDEVIAKREVVIKSLGNRFRTLKGVSSGTVLAGGKIGLVIDIDQLVDLSIAEPVS